jgi:pyridoxamine 5'-phosphate oxidase
MKIDLPHTEYERGQLDESQLRPDPLEQFALWFKEASADALTAPHANAMALATVGADGRPLARTVLLKSYDRRGFVFFTNLESRKARQIRENPEVCLLFAWLPLERQVVITGTARKIPVSETLAYFLTRPRGSQLGAWVSSQSSVITSRKVLEMQWEELKRKFAAGQVPLPSWWGGFRVEPREIEFWQGRPNRLHDRFLYTPAPGGAWTIARLAP